jgi:tetratricopeptide (TPR) repeat protein
MLALLSVSSNTAGMKISIYFLSLAGMWLHPAAAQWQPILCGKPVAAPAMSANRKQQLETDLTKAISHYYQQPDADGLIWVARRLGYLGQYDSAIAWLSHGLQQYPGDARIYRHRGHRYLTLRCFDKAIADLQTAATLVQGQPDETEPDGAPNAAGIPTSTLHTNIYYHLALAHYLKKEYPLATAAWNTCYQISPNPDMQTAAANWLYLSLRVQLREPEASKLLHDYDFKSPLLENEVYRSILKLHHDKPSAAEALQTASKNEGGLQNATYLYGLLMYLKLNGHAAEAKTVKTWLLNSSEVASFGFIAAENEH